MDSIDDRITRSKIDRFFDYAPTGLNAFTSAGFALTSGIFGYEAITESMLRGHSIVLAGIAGGASFVTGYAAFLYNRNRISREP
jgi:hypothetical protein